jgi:hypothetical protein
MDQDVLKKPDKSIIEKIYVGAQIGLVLLTLFVSAYQVNEYFSNKNKK